MILLETSKQEQIMDKLTKVCICKAIPRSKIKEAIKNGAKTVEEVKIATGATTGGCKGRRCTHKIQELLDNALKNQ